MAIILEEGCIRTGAICQIGVTGLYALGDLYHYGSGDSGAIIFRHREPVNIPPRNYLNGIFRGWEHNWVNGDLTITIAKAQHFQYFGYEGKPI